MVQADICVIFIIGEFHALMIYYHFHHWLFESPLKLTPQMENCKACCCLIITGMLLLSNPISLDMIRNAVCVPILIQIIRHVPGLDRVVV